MATVTFEAKLRQAFRLLCVDKNITANLSASFSMGRLTTYNYSPLVMDLPQLPGVLPYRVVKMTLDVTARASVSRTDERYKTYGGGNVIIDGYFVTGQSYKIISVGNTDWNAIAGTTGQTYAVGSEFTAANSGQTPTVSPASFIPDDTRNPTPKTGKAMLANWSGNFSLTCRFPTYIEIDVEKLNLPEGTDCIVQFDDGFVVEDRGRKLPSGAWEYPDNIQNYPSPANSNFVTFRTPWFGLSFMKSNFTTSFAYRNFRPFSSNISSAFTPVVSAKLNAKGVIDLQSAFGAVIIAGEIVRPLSLITLNAIAGPMGPGSIPYLEGNGYPYATGLGVWPQGFPGILRIRRDSAAIANATTASLSAEVYNLPYIFSLHDLSSNFTMTPNADAYKGVGTPHLQAQSSVSANTTANYNTSVPTMQANATLFCRTPVQAQANLTATSSVSADIGQALELVWETQSANETLGIVFKGPNINVTLRWSDGQVDYVNGVTTNPLNLGDSPTSYYYTRTVSTARNIYVRIYGSLSGFQMTKQGVDYINGEINSDDSYLGPGSTYAVAGRNRLVACNGWGDLGITNLMGAFANCSGLDSVPTFLPKNVSNTACMFLNCVNINDPNMILWNTSTITSMAGMFRQASQFNQPIGVWDTGNVVYMSRMFRGGNSNNYPSTLRDSSFNQSLNGWDVTNVSGANMTEMFYFNEVMAGNCNQWCVSHIATVPTRFASSTTATWPTANRPQWGTCP